jgi:hypothetical protein
VEAEEDSAAGAVEHARPTLDRPIPCENPMVQIQPVGSDVVVGSVLVRAAVSSGVGFS